jgi:hypothetical protein
MAYHMPWRGGTLRPRVGLVVMRYGQCWYVAAHNPATGYVKLVACKGSGWEILGEGEFCARFGKP